jgi:hypothetical protein
MPKIPTVIARDVKAFRAEDTPDEIIEALEKEISSMADPDLDAIDWSVARWCGAIRITAAGS